MPIFQVRPENLIKQIPSNGSGVTTASKLECRENDVEAICSVELQKSLGKRLTSSLTKCPAWITCSANSSSNSNKQWNANMPSYESISEEGKRKQVVGSGMSQWTEVEIQLIYRLTTYKIKTIYMAKMADVSLTLVG